MADFVNLNSLLQQVDWENLDTSNDYQDLPEGFYLCEVERAELKTNKAETNMQVSFKFKVVEDGVASIIDNRGYSALSKIPETAGKPVFKHYPFKDIAGIKRFVSDMMKFEGEIPGQPLLEKEYFMTEEIIPDALAILVGRRIYIQASYKEYQGKRNCWYDIISWDRAKEMDLPV